MLVSVHIENIALIKNIDISFGDGFNVLTGETGAGKSIIIDALSLLCGGRSDREIIRTGEDFALVEGVFSELSKKTESALAALDVYPDEDGFLFLQRRLSSDGRSVAKIGTRQVPVAKLKMISPLLIAIHGQQDTQILADSKKQLGLLDGFAKNAKVFEDYKAEYEKYLSLQRKQESLRQNEEEKNYRLDMICFRLSEIEKAGLSVGEEEQLIQERKMLSNREKILTHANIAYDNLYRAQNSVLEKLGITGDTLNELTGIIPEVDSLAERLSSAKYEIEDIAETILSYTDEESENPIQRLDRVEERLELINSLKRKFKSDVEGIIKEYDRLKAEKESIENSSALIEELDLQIKAQLKILREKADSLTRSRRQAAADLVTNVKQTLTFLDMPQVRFEIEFSDKEFGTDGNTSVSFLISANAGEEPKPIAKIASGGELARVMLALKSIPSDTENSVMIFDEIDSGISGKTSEKIGIKLSDTAKNAGCQVICVTHSAQIAAKAKTHLLITKSEDKGRTITKVTELKNRQRVDELARIIGGVTITDTVRKTAEEMIKRK